MLYGLFGYGRGHATRALSVLPQLTRRHDILIIAGGDAYNTLAPFYPVVRIPTLRYAYHANGERSSLRTFTENFGPVADIVFRGESFQRVLRLVRKFRPEVAISDAEPWTHTVASHLRVPRISFDHFGILAHCRPHLAPGDTLRYLRDVSLYRVVTGKPERVIVSSFYDAKTVAPGVRFVGPLLREEVREAPPVRGDHLLVYFNQGEHQFTPHVESSLRSLSIPAKVYGTERRGISGNLEFCAPGNRSFVDDLASCRAVVSTAGNQLVGEALHLRKPILVTPEECVEQRVNALAVERLGIGRQVAAREFGPDTIRSFLSQEAHYIENAKRVARDGRAEALSAIEEFAGELVPSKRPVRAGAWRLA